MNDKNINPLEMNDKNTNPLEMNDKIINAPSNSNSIYTLPTGKNTNPLKINFANNGENKGEIYIDTWRHENYPGDGGASYTFITNCYNSGSGNGSDISCYKKYVVGHTYTVYFRHKGTQYNVVFLITGYKKSGMLTIKFLSNPSSELLKLLYTDRFFTVVRAYKSKTKTAV